MNPRLLSAFFLAAATIPSVFGWGQKGHDTVAFIAQNHLTPTALQAAEELLDGQSIVYWANWLDNASHTPEYAYTKTWHYRNVDEGESLESAPLNPNGDVIRAINAQVEILSDSTVSRPERQLALKILVHIVGDLHQPLHMGHLSDLGGNTWKVKYFNSDKNLHSVWDSSLVESAHKWSHTEWQRELDRVSPEDELQLVYSSDPSDWARESQAIAERIYKTTPQGSNLSYDYIAEWTPTIEGQLLKGGLRLARLLNTVFDPQYAATSR